MAPAARSSWRPASAGVRRAGTAVATSSGGSASSSSRAKRTTRRSRRSGSCPNPRRKVRLQPAPVGTRRRPRHEPAADGSGRDPPGRPLRGRRWDDRTVRAGPGGEPAVRRRILRRAVPTDHRQARGASRDRGGRRRPRLAAVRPARADRARPGRGRHLDGALDDRLRARLWLDRPADPRRVRRAAPRARRERRAGPPVPRDALPARQRVGEPARASPATRSTSPRGCKEKTAPGSRRRPRLRAGGRAGQLGLPCPLLALAASRSCFFRSRAALRSGLRGVALGLPRPSCACAALAASWAVLDSLAHGAAVVAVLAAGGFRSGDPCHPGAMAPSRRGRAAFELRRRDFLAGLLVGRRGVLGGARLPCVGRSRGLARASAGSPVCRLRAGFVIGLGNLAHVAAVVAVRAAGPTAVRRLGHGDLAVAVEVRGLERRSGGLGVLVAASWQASSTPSPSTSWNGALVSDDATAAHDDAAEARARAPGRRCRPPSRYAVDSPSIRFSSPPECADVRACARAG